MRLFQYMDMDHVGDMMIWSWMWWILLGLPSILVIIVATIFVEPFRHRRFQCIVWSLPLLGLLFGASTGYFEAWTYYHDQREPQRWYESLALFGEPGDSIATCYVGDWQDDEAWDYRKDIAAWNGFFWAGVATVASSGMFFVRRCAASTLTPPA